MSTSPFTLATIESQTIAPTTRQLPTATQLLRCFSVNVCLSDELVMLLDLAENKRRLSTKNNADLVLRLNFVLAETQITLLCEKESAIPTMELNNLNIVLIPSDFIMCTSIFK
jgi:hypothetical protein